MGAQGRAWTDNPLDPEDTGNFQRPVFHVVPPLPPTGEFPQVRPEPARGTAAVEPTGPRHARPSPLPPRTTELFDIVGESVIAAGDALYRSEQAAGHMITAELQELRTASTLLLNAVDALTEGVVVMLDRR